MKKILIILIILFSLLFFRATTVYLLTERLINNYELENYNDSSINILYILNFNQSYIDFYNHGNIYYQQKSYTNAKEKFEIALKKNPPESKICDIEINLALSILGLIEKDNDTSHLKEAREVLYQNGCANEEDDNGKSKKAEELEDEIKKQEEENKTESEDSNSNENTEEQESEENIPNEATKEEQLRKELYENTTGRNNYLDQRENSNNYSYYEGKRW